MGETVTWRAEDCRDRILRLALQIARMHCHAAYLEGDKLVLVAGDDRERYIENFRQELEHEAKNMLMLGGWEELV